MNFLFRTLLIISLCSGCTGNEKEIIQLYRIHSSSHNGTNYIDTLTDFTPVLKIDSSDLFLYNYQFSYKNNYHYLTAFTSDNHAPVDGGVFYITMDSIGIIYIRSTTWYSFSRLYSNNDSLNDLINHACSYILLIPELQNYAPENESIEFIKPDINS